MAVPAKSLAENPEAPERVPRVLKAPPKTFDLLPTLLSAEHEDWEKTLYGQVARLDASIDIQLVQAFAERLLAITQVLAQTHHTPDLGNKPDPVDELVYIILSRRTREDAYKRAFEVLKERYDSWEELATAPSSEIAALISFTGMAERKTHSLKGALCALIDRFGECTLDAIEDWPDDAVLEFLCGLPEVGPKSAACVMVCALDRPAFPVDAHVGRVLERLGVFNELGIHLSGVNHKIKQRRLWDAVPPALRYALHVNLLMHGRTSCTPRKPRCQSCSISTYCLHWNKSEPVLISSQL